jgi:hypothetical protein
LTVAINHANSPLARVASLSLLTSLHERKVRVASLTSRVAQVTSIDCPYITLAARNEKEFITLAALIEKELKELRARCVSFPNLWPDEQHLISRPSGSTENFVSLIHFLPDRHECLHLAGR